MNRQEVTELLASAAAVDQYAPQPGELVLRIWESLLADIPAEAAEKALVAHYRETSKTITPADIAGWFRNRRRYASPTRKAPPADPETIRTGVDRVFTALAAKKAISAAERTGTEVDLVEVEQAVEADVAARRSVRSVPCRHCHAPAFEPCTSNGRPLTKSPAHPVRVDDAFAAMSASTG